MFSRLNAEVEGVIDFFGGLCLFLCSFHAIESFEFAHVGADVQPPTRKNNGAGPVTETRPPFRRESTGGSTADVQNMAWFPSEKILPAVSFHEEPLKPLELINCEKRKEAIENCGCVIPCRALILVGGCQRVHE